MLKKIKKYEKKLESRWVGQAPTRIWCFLEILCFGLFFCCRCFQKKKNWVWLFFSDFCIFFNLTKPLSVGLHVFASFVECRPH